MQDVHPLLHMTLWWVLCALQALGACGLNSPLVYTDFYQTSTSNSSYPILLAPGVALAGQVVGKTTAGLPEGCAAACTAATGCDWFNYCGKEVRIWHSAPPAAQPGPPRPPLLDCVTLRAKGHGRRGCYMKPCLSSSLHVLTPQGGCRDGNDGEPLTSNECRLLGGNCSSLSPYAVARGADTTAGA